MSRSMQEIWEISVAAWSETDSKKRLALLRQAFSEQVIYTDPVIQTQGYEQLARYMDDLRKNIPGAHFVTASFHEHHNLSLAKWNLLDGAGHIVADGASHGEYDGNGRISKTSAFYKLPGAN